MFRSRSTTTTWISMILTRRHDRREVMRRDHHRTPTGGRESDFPPPPSEEPPPSIRADRQRAAFVVPHTDGQVLSATGRSHYADQQKLPRVLRMKTTIDDLNLGPTTIGQFIRLANDDGQPPVVQTSAVATLIKLNADPRNPLHLEAAGIEPMVEATPRRPGRDQLSMKAQGRAASPDSSSTCTEAINPEYGSAVRSASQHPKKAPRTEPWRPELGAKPMSTAEAAARHGRSPATTSGGGAI